MVFSIIIPVYNVEKYIEKCLESVVTQDFDSFEVIVVDDGSTDKSGEICDVYEEKYPKVTVIHQENSGLAAARNAGLEVAQGEWIVFVDSDDWIHQEMLQRLHGQMLMEKADLYCYNAYKTNERGIVTDKLIFSPENKEFVLDNEKSRFQFYINVLMQYKVGWEAWSRIYCRDIIEQHKIRFQNCAEIFAEDYLFTFQYLLYAKNIIQLCDLLYFYRQRKDSLIHTVNHNSILERLHKWAVYAYDMVKKERMAYFVKNYHMIVFMLFNYHLQYMLSQMIVEEVEKIMKDFGGNRLHRKWMRQLRKRKYELWDYMRIKKWL